MANVYSFGFALIQPWNVEIILKTDQLNQGPIAIIGAGMSGIACAAALQAAGLATEVFEKNRGMGGRLCTRRGEVWQADHGAQYFTAQSAEFQHQVLAWLEEGVIAEWQPRLAVIGGRAQANRQTTVRYVGTPGMSAPVKALGRDLVVHERHTVVETVRRGALWQLRTEEHGWIDREFCAVIIAIPSTQAGALLTDISPALSRLASESRMLASWTLMAQFNTPLLLPFDAAFVNTGPLRWLSRNNSKPGRLGQESWVLQATAPWSDAHLEDQPDDVIRLLLEAFKLLGGAEPATVIAHRWRYADCVARSERSIWDSGTCIGLCGDWLSAGKVEGAWWSGRTLASKILNEIPLINT